MTISKKILEEIANRAEAGDGLAMDYSARMQRAKEQGFDTDTVYYHGSDADIGAFNTDGKGKTSGAGAFFTSDPKVAETYASKRGGNITPVYLKKGDELLAEAEGANWNSIPYDTRVYTDESEVVSDNPLNELFDTDEYDDIQYFSQDEGDLGYFIGEDVYTDGASTDDIARFAKSRGLDSATFQDLRDRGSSGAFNAETGNSDVVAVFDPSNIRSVNAAFDPAKKDSSNLLASLGAGTVAAGGLLASDDSEAGFINRGGKQVLNAWHGSPNDFDKFDISKVGDGSGQQAFGSGLYFADDKATGELYRDGLGGSDILIDGTSYKDFNEPYQAMAKAIASGRGAADIKEALNASILKNETRLSKLSSSDPRRKNLEKENSISMKRLDAVTNLANSDIKEQKGGALFNVDIDTKDNNLMDFDGILSNQPEGVKDGIKAAQYIIGKSLPEGSYVPAETGGELYEQLRQVFDKNGDIGSTYGSDKTSEWLNKFGVNGMKYKSPSSESSNYVIFDDKIIDIQKKYDLASGALLGGLAAKPTYNAIDDLFAGGELASNLVGSTLLSLGEESLSGLKALGTGNPYARVDLPDYPFPVSSQRGQEMQQALGNAIAPYAEDLSQFSNEWADEGAQYDPAIGALRRTLFETPIVGDALGLIGGLGDTVSSSWDELTDYARQDRLSRGR